MSVRNEEKVMSFLPMAMSAAGGIASIAGSIFGARANKKASAAQVAALKEANAENRRQFDAQTGLARDQYSSQRSLLNPYIKLGSDALPVMRGAYGLGTPAENAAALNRFRTATPDYAFGLAEGQKATEGVLNASGMGLRGGGALRALTRYGQDYATTRFGDWRDSLSVPANYGANATGQGIQASQTYANNFLDSSRNYANAYGQNMMQQGNARASAYGGTANILGQIGQTLGYFGGRMGGGSPMSAYSPATNNLHYAAIAGGAA